MDLIRPGDRVDLLLTSGGPDPVTGLPTTGSEHDSALVGQALTVLIASGAADASGAGTVVVGVPYSAAADVAAASTRGTLAVMIHPR